MSLVQDLADHLRMTREELPAAEVCAATERLRTANGLLAWVLHQSSRPADVPDLASAVARLEHAAAALRVAEDALDGYALALGMPIEANSQPDRAWLISVTVPARATPGHQDGPLHDWWSARVQELTEMDSTVDRADSTDSSAELLRRCVAAALDDDRRALHRHLLAAGPAIGLGLAAIAPPVLRHLADELVGHPARLEDLARVRRAALPMVSQLLPALPNAAAEETIARVCRAQPQHRIDGEPTHPVDAAAAAVLLVAGLIRAGARSVDELSDLVAAQRHAAQAARQQVAERTEVHRAELRITDRGRRHTAVDELGRATPGARTKKPDPRAAQPKVGVANPDSRAAKPNAAVADPDSRAAAPRSRSGAATADQAARPGPR